MVLVKLAMAACWTLLGQANPMNGVIGGVVVRKVDQQPVAETDVVLRAAVNGRFSPVAETVTDAKGKFLFDQLPVGRQFLYLPGANHGEVHYPGPRVRLTPAQPVAGLKLEVCEVIHHPNPLEIREHDIVIQPQPGRLMVSETIVLDNPTANCYVGPRMDEGRTPVTLQLSLPSDFEKVTFEKEFFGRNFSLAGGRLVTDIPWTPGQRELKFTYVLRNEKKHRVWQRPLDLPCDHLRVSVCAAHPEEISCNLTTSSIRSSDTLVFDSDGKRLPAGHVVRVEMGRLPVSLMTYAPWVAVAILLVLILTASWTTIPSRRLRKRDGRRVQPSQGKAASRSTSDRRKHAVGRNTKQTSGARKAA